MTSSEVRARPPAGVVTVLPPAARLLWRSARTAQIEVGARRVLIEGIGPDAARHLLGLDPAADPNADPNARAPLTALQHRLLEAGYLWPGSDPRADLRRVPPAPRLAPELTALSARAGEDAAELLHARRQCSVAVHGRGRAGPHLAAVLAAAGVGRVHVHDSTPTRLYHAVPGGVTPADEGLPLSAAADEAITRCAPDANVMPAPFGETPDLVVLALDEPIDGERRDALHARGCAHLLVSSGAGRASVGPLVLPGLTSCLRCADLHRLDRDPAWNALAVQLTLPHRSGAAGEVALSTVLAGLAAIQALEFLDGGRPATVEGSLELHLPDWRVRRRTWPVHPDCNCMPEPD